MSVTSELKAYQEARRAARAKPLTEAGWGQEKVKADLEPHKRKLAQMTDQNQHPEALLYVAEEVLKDRQMVKVIQGLIALHQFYGSMDSHLSAIFHDIHQKTMARITHKLGAEVGQWFIQGSF